MKTLQLSIHSGILFTLLVSHCCVGDEKAAITSVRASAEPNSGTRAEAASTGAANFSARIISVQNQQGAGSPASNPAQATTGSTADCPCQPAAKPPAKPQPYKNPFYLNNFAYLDKPCAEKTEYFEFLKRIEVGDCVKVDAGGEYRFQFKNEDRRSLLTGLDSNPRADSFTLHRTRIYTDVHYSDWIRGYVEGLDAASFHETLAPLAIDEDRADLLNAFVDLRLFSLSSDHSLWLRAGRQEMLYDNERLISPLDWANTRRTFQGVNLMSRGTKWDVDAFWLRPVIVDDVRFDQPDQSQWIAGVHGSYKCFEFLTINPFYYALREEDVIAGTATGRTHRVGSGNADNLVHTTGVYIKGEKDDWLTELESAFQFGEYGNQDVTAGMFTAGIGRKFSQMTWKPTLWAWYDFASGDNDPTDNRIHTFNQLFPLGHKYFGHTDLVARQNVHDVNLQLFAKPHEKLTLMSWLHFMWLAEKRDALYNVTGAASRQDPTGNSGSEIGQALDLTATYSIRPGVDLQLGYAYFWSGDFIINTGGQNSAYLVYTQFSVKF